MIINAIWLPCSHCGWMPDGCSCRPLGNKEWERRLKKSEAARHAEARIAEHRRLSQRWVAA